MTMRSHVGHLPQFSINKFITWMDESIEKTPDDNGKICINIFVKNTGIFSSRFVERQAMLHLQHACDSMVARITHKHR